MERSCPRSACTDDHSASPVSIFRVGGAATPVARRSTAVQGPPERDAPRDKSLVRPCDTTTAPRHPRKWRALLPLQHVDCRGVSARPRMPEHRVFAEVEMTTGQGVVTPPVTYARHAARPGVPATADQLAAHAAPPSQMWTVGLVLFALQRYHSPSVAGVSLFLLIFPGLLLSPIAGALLDRHGRKRLMTLDFSVAAAVLHCDRLARRRPTTCPSGVSTRCWWAAH